MALEFTIATKSLTDNLDNELDTLKMAALYADKITILSPGLDVIETLNSKNKNKKSIELEIINKLIKSIPVCEYVSKEELKEEKDQLIQLEQVVKSGGYRNSSLVERMKIQNVLKESQKGSVEDLQDIFGEEVISEIRKLGKALNVESFKNRITKKGDYINEYLEKVEKSLSKTMLLYSFDGEDAIIELPAVSDLTMGEILKIKDNMESDIDNFNKALMQFKKELNSESDINEVYNNVLKESYENLMNKFKENNIESERKIKLYAIKRESLLRNIEKNVDENIAILGNDGTSAVNESLFENKEDLDLYFSYN